MSLLDRFARNGNYEPEEPVAKPVDREEIRARLKSLNPDKLNPTYPQTDFFIELGRDQAILRHKQAQEDAQKPKG